MAPSQTMSQQGAVGQPRANACISATAQTLRPSGLPAWLLAPSLTVACFAANAQPLVGIRVAVAGQFVEPAVACPAC